MSRSLRKFRSVALALGAALAGVCAGGIEPGLARADEHHHGGSDDRYTIALRGDMPYNALGKQQYPNLLLDVNDAHVAFSFFDGDLKSGGDGPCTDENLYTPALDDFSMLERPLVWVPGDNDWTDCWGRYGAGTSAPGADDPIERLQHERQLFASTPFSLGQKKLRLTRESSEGGAYAQYSENVRFKYGPVVYLGVNVQGSNELDMPLSTPAGGVVANFTRVETFGARNTHWVAATIDRDNPRVFSFEPRIVAANVD